MNKAIVRKLLGAAAVSATIALMAFAGGPAYAGQTVDGRCPDRPAPQAREAGLTRPLKRKKADAFSQVQQGAGPAPPPARARRAGHSPRAGRACGDGVDPAGGPWDASGAGERIVAGA